MADDRELRDRVALHQVDRLAELLVRLDRDQLGDAGLLGPLRAKHLGDGGRRRAAVEEAVLQHPVVVVELREVRTPAVGDQRHDGRVRAEALGDAERGVHRGSAGAADEQAVLPRERAVRKESRSETVTYSSTRLGSYVCGQKSSPIPSTR